MSTETQVSNFLADQGLGEMGKAMHDFGFKTIDDLHLLRNELCGGVPAYPIPSLVAFLGSVPALSALTLKNALAKMGRNIDQMKTKYATTAEKMVMAAEEKAKEELLEQDKQALLACLEENPQWGIRVNWKKCYTDGTSLPSWDYVCGSDRVTELDLESRKVTGKIPSAIGRLVMLKRLDISNCAVEGPVPESFSNLINLEKLLMRETGVQGGVPEFLAKLPKLETCDITFAEAPPDDRAALKAMMEENPQWDERFGWLKALEDGVSLSGFKGIEAAGERVVALDATCNKLLGTVPPSIGKLTALTKIILSGNSVDGPLPDMQALVKLQKCLFKMTHIKEDAPAALKQLPNMKECEVSYQEEPPSFLF